MRYQLKRLGCYLLIIILLPYIITVFLNGSSILTSAHVDATKVNVRQDENVVSIPLSEYGIGILAKEIPADYEEEAIKCQAILVRTDIYTKLNDGTQQVFEESYWTKSKMQEAWGSHYMKNYRKMEDAWKTTEGKVLTYQGALAKAPFFRLSNGSTRDGAEALGDDAYPYLKIVECPLDVEAKDEVRTITIDDIDAEVTEYDTAGYVKTVRVGNDSINGEEFRTNYHLASSCFTLQKYNGKLRITTRGIGHGLGLSQNTAQAMAEEGADMDGILNYFFAGTEVKEVTEIVTDQPNTNSDWR